MNQYAREQICQSMAAAESVADEQANYGRLMTEGQLTSLNLPTDGADKQGGAANWVGYLPSVDRAAWVSNGDPVWFDADSLEHAIILVREADAAGPEDVDRILVN